ncbi:MAG: flagellar export protein FliJ [Desulfamplus sp.]|nr:flagellar export protein FliJ [Desulfamplus sp.]
MKKFTFKLQSVLKYRRHLETLARQEAMKALMDVNECEKMIADMKRDLDLLARQVEDETVKGISSALFRQYNEYLDSLDDDIKLKEQEHIRLQQTLSLKQKALTDKSVDRKIIERLREKQRTSYIEEMLAEEQKTMDDISSLKKAREVSNDLS